MLCKLLVMEKMEIGVNFTCVVPSGAWAQVLWLFWGLSFPGECVVIYFVLVDLLCAETCTPGWASLS